MNIHEIEKIINFSCKANNNQSNIDSYAFAEAIRDIAVIELQLATRIRVSELSHLRDDCIGLHTGKVCVRGKGNKEQIIQICNEEEPVWVLNAKSSTTVELFCGPDGTRTIKPSRLKSMQLNVILF